MSDHPQNITTASEPRVRLIGVGGAGASALSHIARTPLAHLPLALVHTHARVLQQHPIPDRILIGSNRTHGLGAGGDAELARVMADAEFGRLSELAAGTDLVFLVAGLGGGTGTGVTPVLARAARKAGALVIAIVTTPFGFEGPRRHQQAVAGLQILRAAADAVICLPNQTFASMLDDNTTIIEAFDRTNQFLAQGILGLWRMLTRPGLINVDFAYLDSVLRGRHTESVLAMAEARGPNRARDVLEQLLANPFLDGGETLAAADQILVSLAGAQDLTIAEINRVMDQLKAHAGEKQLILGTAIDSTYTDQISITLIASKNGKNTGGAPGGADGSGPATAHEPQSAGPSAFLEEDSTPRPLPRFVAPPPETTVEKTRELLDKYPNSRKKTRWKQEMLALEIVSRGRFEKSEPTIHRGADLDVPTYVRRGVPLN